MENKKTFSDEILDDVNNGNPIEDIFEEDFDKIQFIDNIDEIRFVRVDKLPTEKRKELQKKGIYDGIVKFEIKDKVVILGSGDKMILWNPEYFEKHIAQIQQLYKTYPDNADFLL